MIVAVRHGPVAAAGLCYGRWDPPLVHPAHEDAARIAERLDGMMAPHADAVAGLRLPPPRRIISSPAARCQTVAALLAPRLGTPLVIDERLAELSMGDWEGRSWAEIEAVDGVRLAAWMNRWESEAAPGGETLPDFQTRVRAAAAEITEPAIWITHAGVIRTLRVLERGISWPEAMRAAVAHLEPEPFGETRPTG